MNSIKNYNLIVSESHTVTLDVYWLADSKPKPIVTILHDDKSGSIENYSIFIS